MFVFTAALLIASVVLRAKILDIGYTNTFVFTINNIF